MSRKGVGEAHRYVDELSQLLAVWAPIGSADSDIDVSVAIAPRKLKVFSLDKVSCVESGITVNELGLEASKDWIVFKLSSSSLTILHFYPQLRGLLDLACNISVDELESLRRAVVEKAKKDVVDGCAEVFKEVKSIVEAIASEPNEAERRRRLVEKVKELAQKLTQTPST
ncbi:MAG: hypothetical protein JHC33_14265 [Ignisphaera sp.]|nr:hypothetical protein [Ignisphaera sp.]